jgi:hypothetical protein
LNNSGVQKDIEVRSVLKHSEDFCKYNYIIILTVMRSFRQYIWWFLSIPSPSEGWIRPFRSLQNILIFYIGIKLEVASNSTPMVDFAIAINRILTHPCTPLRGRKISPVGGTGMDQKMNLKIFKKFWWKYSQYTLSILNTQSQRNFIHWLSHGPERVKLKISLFYSSQFARKHFRWLCSSII